ncbi:uncharacterized protein LOC134272411 [Saccostrea cucullata]
MSVEKCKEFCQQHDSRFYGLEDSNKCFCGNVIRQNVRKAEKECNARCSGNDNQFCGGNSRISVYKNANYEKGYLGCFQDQSTRTLNGKHMSSNSMTVEMCKEFCKKQDAEFYGLESSMHCYCGNLTQLVRKPEMDCSQQCRGNSDQFCGGHWRISIYKNRYIIPFECKESKAQINCTPKNGKRGVCVIKNAELVLNVAPSARNPTCARGETYGRHGDEIWVSEKCGGLFTVCFKEVKKMAVTNGKD